MAKAAVVANVYVSADYNSTGSLRLSNTRITMDGDPNCWPNGNPNWTEAVVGSFMAGSYLIGVGNVSGFLEGYSHAAFKTELTNRGLINVYNTFNVTQNATVNAYVNNILDNDNNNKPFFRGMKLSAFVTDPFKFYFEAMGKETYKANATEGDYVGELGRATEFASTDGGGSDGNIVRDSLGYVIHGLNHSIGNRFILEYFGYWASTSYTTQRTNLLKWMKVGFSDLLGKARNGYWSRGNGHEDYHISSTDVYFPYFESLAQNYGLFKPILFSENYDDGNFTGWIASGSWSILNSEPTWSGSTTKLDPIVQLLATSGISTLVSGYSGTNYVVYTSMKYESCGGAYCNMGIIGKYIDANNYYVMRYKQDNQKLQIVKVKNGSSNLITETTFTWNAGVTKQMKAVFGTNGIMQLYVDGGTSPKVTMTDTEYASGKAGLYASFANAEFDDVLVTAP
ncbi:hypothetical protein EHS13_27805 [Paenibacillus psychroresistens]|uniref:Uncharacterized protein n=2 Tax=Paenibacillus psychroresistens TaxID=1778678 RepID=A0A6B8RR22_9BACL|nr:hypothetical protein EHS13_27805 [Paenibacillus psychroresistens]